MNNPLNIRKAAVLGSGVMGAQIAAHLVNAGIEVLLYDLASKGTSTSLLSEQAIDALKKLKPAPLARADGHLYIYPVNYDEHLEQLKDCDWIIEAISERLDWKKNLYEKILPFIHETALLTTNTSGLSIEKLAQVLPDFLKPRFLGVHFFNPPRYMSLVELIPHAQTNPVLLDRLEEMLVSTLGKGVVRAKDTPNFIGNRIGVFALLTAIYYAERFKLSPEVVDQLTGPLLGRPKSATFRTLDVVGLDTLAHVVKTMEKDLTNDPWIAYFKVPHWISQLADKGAFGQKTKKGVYQKKGTDIFVYDVDTDSYRLAIKKADPQILEVFQKNGAQSFQMLRLNPHPQAQFLWACLRDLWHYCAYHLNSIAESVRDIDQCMRWGYGWAEGPFESWQRAGWPDILLALEDDILSGKTRVNAPLPAWIHQGPVSPPPKALPVYHRQLSAKGTTVFENAGLKVWTNDDLTLIASFKTPQNCISLETLIGIQEAVALAEIDHKPLILYQTEGPNFSVGANLKQATEERSKSGGMDRVRHMVEQFQRTMMALRYSRIPTICAVKGLVLGGGCELLMHCDHTVAALESYIGLVEVGVGLIPAAGGSKELALRAYQQTKEIGQRYQWLEKFFKQIALATVSGSAYDAIRLGYLKDSDTLIMNPQEILYVAQHYGRTLLEAGYSPPLPPKIAIGGWQAFANLQAILINMKAGHFISEHDYLIGTHLARVLSGGELDPDTLMPESWFLTLEIEAFLALAATEKTWARVAHTLKTGKPLRN